MKQPTVFIVEDDRDTREMIGRFLELEGYSVESAANGRQALDLLDEGTRVCVILLDLMMPVMDGWEFRRRQRQMDPAIATIPVVVFTADGGVQEKAAAVGAIGGIGKPIGIDALLEVVARHCRSPIERRTSERG